MTVRMDGSALSSFLENISKIKVGTYLSAFKAELI